MLLSDASSTYLILKSARCSPTTMETDKIHLRQLREFLGDVDVDDVDATDITRFLAHEKERGLSPYTIKRQYATFSAFWSWLTSPDIALAESNPTDVVPVPKTPEVKPKALDPEDIEKLVRACSESRLPRRDKALILFAYQTGARASEICGVRLPHVGFETGKVLLKETKGGSERYVYLAKRALSSVLLYVKDERCEPVNIRDNFLFLSIHGLPLNRDSLRGICYRLADRAGVKCSPHRLRHSCAIAMLRGGASLLHVRAALGHRELETTRRYLTALNDEDLKKVMERASPVDNLRL